MTKDQVAAILNRIPEARWDRMTVGPGLTRVFGWLARQDEHSDFVLLDFYGDLEDGMPEDFTLSLVTSSAEMSEEVGKRVFGADSGPHDRCRRVELELAGLVGNAVTL